MSMLEKQLLNENERLKAESARLRLSLTTALNIISGVTRSLEIAKHSAEETLARADTTGEGR